MCFVKLKKYKYTFTQYVENMHGTYCKKYVIDKINKKHNAPRFSSSAAWRLPGKP